MIIDTKMQRERPDRKTKDVKHDVKTSKRQKRERGHEEKGKDRFALSNVNIDIDVNSTPPPHSNAHCMQRKDVGNKENKRER